MPEEKPKIQIDSVSWGKIFINGQKFDQVIISGGKVLPRETEKLEKLFGTTHTIGDWEQELLSMVDPEVIIIGNGYNGVLKVSGEMREKLGHSGAEIKVLLTPAAVSEFQKLVSQGKRVSALIHTTC